MIKPFLRIASFAALAALFFTSTLSARSILEGQALLILEDDSESSIDINEGELVVAADLTVTGNYAQNDRESFRVPGGTDRSNRTQTGVYIAPDPVAGILTIVLGPDSGSVAVQGTAALGGELRVQRLDGYTPETGTEYTILTADGGVSGDFGALIDESGLSVEIVYESNAVKLRTTRETDPDATVMSYTTGQTTVNYAFTGTRGVVVNEDWSDGTVDYEWRHPNANTGQFPSDRAEFDYALIHRIDHNTFTWGVAFLSVPQVRVGADDVLVMDFITYSDVAYNNNSNWAKPEVALLRDNPLAGFGHD